MKGNGERLRNLMPEEHSPIPYSMVSENTLPFPFSKANQEKTKLFLFAVYLKRTFKQA